MQTTRSQARLAIEHFFADRSVSPRETLAGLEELADLIQMDIEAIQDDLAREDDEEDADAAV